MPKKNLEMAKGDRVQEHGESLGVNHSERTAQLEEKSRELEKRVKELSALNQVSQVMSSVFDLDELLDLIIDLITQETEAQRGSIMLLDPTTEELFIKAARGLSPDVIESARPKVGEGFAGWVVKESKPLLISDVEKDERFPVRASDPKYSTKSLLCVPLIAKDGVIGAININNKLSGNAFTNDDLGLVTTLAGGASLAVENARLHQNLTERERINRELEIARQIQEGFLPQEMPQIDGYQISALSLPAVEVGGDYYDFIPVDDNHWGIFVGDVSGKGVPAAIYLSMARSIIRTQVMGVLSSKEALSRANYTLAQHVPDTDSAMFLTAFYILLDLARDRVIYTNAGHGPALLYCRGERECRELENEGLVLGLTEDWTYQEGEFALEEGDVILLYTDGATEARNKKEDMLGLSGLRSLLERYSAANTQDILNGIHQGILDFTDGTSLHDDLTLMVIKKT